MVDALLGEINEKVRAIEGVEDLVFDPPWHKDMMSGEAKLELGFL